MWNYDGTIWWMNVTIQGIPAILDIVYDKDPNGDEYIWGIWQKNSLLEIGFTGTLDFAKSECINAYKKIK